MKIMNTPTKRRILGVMLFIFAFFWTSYLDRIGFYVEPEWLELLIALSPAVIGGGLLFWDTKFVQEGL